MLLEQISDFDTVFYDVRAGDTLGSIINKYYGSISPQKRKEIIDNLLLENPEIKNPNLIYPGQNLVIDIPRLYCAAPGLPPQPAIQANKEVIETLKKNLKTATPPEKKLVSALAPIMLGAGATSMDMVKHTFKSNTSLLADIAENYNDFKADDITKGQYDYRRQTLLKQLKAKLGPTNYLLNGSRSPNEVIRISRTKGSLPTHIITRQADRMKTLSRVASKGGVVLTAVGLGVACHEIANTEEKQQKNEILVESLGGVAGGLVYGMGATAMVMLMATPIGWTAALLIGVGGVVTSFGASQLAKNAYTTYGTHIDFASIIKINELCR